MGAIWSFFKKDKKPEQGSGGLLNGWVRPYSNGANAVHITLNQEDNGGVRTHMLKLSRNDARMLAKRISECLEETY